MALGSSDVYSQANPGLAQVLGSTLGPLRLIQQQTVQAQRERLAAARLKQQQEATDARNIVPLEANGWLPHNDELTAAVQAGYEKQKQIYADPTKSLFQKRAEAQQIASTLKQQADRSNELNARYKQTVALASDPRYDKAALEAGAYGTFYQTDPETGQRAAVPLAKYDPSALDNAATNPAFFNRDKVLQTFIKAEADKESVRLGKAAPSGGYGVNRQASSDIFDVNPDGTLAINADGSYKIRDINALVQRAHADPFMAAILRDNAAKAQQEAGASVMANYGQLTPEQNAALNGLQRTAPAEKADLATMLAPYGKTKASSVQTYRAAPRPSAAGKPKYVTNANTNGGAGFVPIMDNGQEVGYPSTYIGQAPTKTKVSTGETVGYGYDGAQHGQYILRIPGKNDEVVSNNREPQSVQYGNHFTALVTKSGKPVRPVDKNGNPVNLQGQDLLDFYRREREKDPSLTVETIINGSPRKGKNELGDREAIAESLGKSYSSSIDAVTKRKLTREELLKKADDIIAKQNASYQYVYRGTTKREIDSYAPGAYNSKEKAAEIERARREADEASRPRATAQRGPLAARMAQQKAPAATPNSSTKKKW